MKIISGGQTGVDQASLRAARDMGAAFGGWCPPGRRADDGPIPEEFGLVETPHDRSPHAPDLPRSLRTEWNVRDSSATLILCRAGQLDPGSRFAWDCAHRLGRPSRVLDPASPHALEQARSWLASIQPHILHVAGPAESQASGIGEASYRFVLALLA